MSLVVLGAELHRAFRLARSYWLEYISDFVLYAAGFLLLMAVFRAASDDFGPRGYLATLIGFVTWKVCAGTMAGIADTVVEESRTGTLEQMFLGGLRPGLAFLGRSAGIFLNHAARGLVLATALAAFLGILRPIPLFAIVVFVLTAAGPCGLGFALAGLALVYKRLDGLVHLVWQMLVFFTGALAPMTHPVLAGVARALPLGWGITCLRALVVEGATAASLWRSGDLLGLLLNTACYVALGAALFAWGERRARTLGVLGHY